MSTTGSDIAEDNGPAWRRRKSDRPGEIKAAAKRLLEARGMAGVSVARIATEANVSEALVYRYFDSKQALVNQVLTDWATPFIVRLLDELESVKGARARLTRIAISFLRNMEETPRLHKVYYQELRWADYQGSPLHRLNRRFTNTVVETVEDGIASGELRADLDSAMVRDMLFGGLEHVAMRTSLAGRQADADLLARSYVDMMLDGLRAEKQPADISSIAAAVSRLEAKIDGLSG
ncbi:hypothetical protein GCM10011371_29850 [Novosphingobium marinum]|uniref:AcrR family transcriptional regulator n=1 Tax=Novosphingobium marinum TaxID=1514948 RepID=A0A7Z0BVX8_9SPHN|nr:TetR/AcrR family transcriptional regulator [Novosphingobium marinum]NYH96753.1 AcrR family transcriptional regulator [Novosphingobium marinum]GGC40484.1 hypothetical protein GCM10011371_29850 [Novosphingobium marinum]